METQEVSLEQQVEKCRETIDKFYRNNFISVSKLLVKFTTMKVKYAGQNTATRLQSLISLQEYYEVRLERLENLEKEISLYSNKMRANDNKLDSLYTQIVGRSIKNIQSELETTVNEIQEMIETCFSYTNTVK